MRHNDLIVRLEKAERPSRELFEAAYVACRGTVDWGPEGNWHPFRKFLDFINAEAWTDAALMLMPPEWKAILYTENGMCELYPIKGVKRPAGVKFRIQGDDLPVAICIAALRALEDQQ